MGNTTRSKHSRQYKPAKQLTGAFSWDNGCVAFDNPMEVQVKLRARRKRLKDEWKDRQAYKNASK